MSKFKVGDRVKQRKSTQGAGKWKRGTVVELREDPEFDIGVLDDGGEIDEDGYGLWWMNAKEIKHA